MKQLLQKYLYIFTIILTVSSYSFLGLQAQAVDVSLSKSDTANKTKNLNSYKFPEKFFWGTAICEYQNSGSKSCPDCQWSHWEKNLKYKSGASCDFWNLYKEDIKRMKEFGLNSLRLSIAWDRIEPEQGVFNEEAINHYVNVCDELIKAGIEPMITLHHFTHPMWFEKLGAFEKEDNIKYFVRFSKVIFEKLSSKVKLWCTINEPTIYMFQGYLRNVFPPGKMGRLFLALKVLKNLLQAHTETYDTLKKLPNGDECQIGFVHQYLKFESYRWWNLGEKFPASFLNHILNTVVLHYCKTGEFAWIPQASSATMSSKKLLDFMGLNYYSRVLLKLQASITEPAIATCGDNEVMTDMPYPIYAKGLYDAVSEISKIGVPIYITENGIADAKDDKRSKFFKEYLSELARSVKDGYDVRGYYCWTFADNFEWDEGFTMRFGLYKVDFETQERTLREGSKAFKDFIAATTFVTSKNK